MFLEQFEDLFCRGSFQIDFKQAMFLSILLVDSSQVIVNVHVAHVRVIEK